MFKCTLSVHITAIKTREYLLPPFGQPINRKFLGVWVPTEEGYYKKGHLIGIGDGSLTWEALNRVGSILGAKDGLVVGLMLGIGDGSVSIDALDVIEQYCEQ